MIRSIVSTKTVPCTGRPCAHDVHLGRFWALGLLAICPKLALISTCMPKRVGQVARFGIDNTVLYRLSWANRSARSALAVFGVRDDFRVYHAADVRRGREQRYRLRALPQVDRSLQIGNARHNRTQVDSQELSRNYVLASRGVNMTKQP